MKVIDLWIFKSENSSWNLSISQVKKFSLLYEAAVQWKEGSIAAMKLYVK